MRKKVDIPVEEIIEKRKRGTTLNDLAKEYGVSRSLIGKKIDEYYKEKDEEKLDLRKSKIELPIEKIIEKRKRRVTLEQLAKEYGVSPSLIGKRIDEYYEEKGEEKPDYRVQGNPKKELPIEEIIGKREKGINPEELAQEYGVSKSTISKRLDEYYEEKGEEKPDLRKINKELPIEEIIEKIKKGINPKELAQEYGVSESAINRRINEYYNSGEMKKYKILKSDYVVVEYLKKGLTPEQIREVAKNSKIVIPQSVMDSAIAKVEGQKTIQSEEERDK